MINSFISGFLGGFLLCFTLGTVFFAMLQNSIDNGYWSGVKVSIGGIISDILLIFAATIGTSFLPNINHFDMILRSIGAIFLIGLGLGAWIKKTSKVVYPTTKVGDLFYYLGIGFTINTVNPVNFFVWATAAAAIKHLDSYNTFIFFSGSITAIFLTQFIMCYYASYLHKYFNEKVITLINRGVGLAFIGSGLYLGSIVFKFLFYK